MTTSHQPVRRADQLQTVQRWDRVQLEAQLEPASRTAQGYLRTHAAVAVPGVMEYMDAAGNVTRELVPPEELHNVDSLRSLAGLPVTLQHPDEDVTPDNVGSLGVGSMGNDVEILEQSGHVRVLLVLHRRDALDAVEQGMVEVSPGYTTVIDPTPGVWNGQAYDAVQTRRRYNHLAIVDQARGGPTVKLRADGDDRLATRRCDAADPHNRVQLRVRLDAQPPDTDPPQRGPTMHPFLITLAALCALPYTQRADGKVYRTDMGAQAGDPKQITEDQLVAAIADAIRQLQSKAAEADADPAAPAAGELTMEQAKARIQELEGQLATLQAEKESMDAAAAAEQAKADRAQLEGLADRLSYDRAAWTEATTNAQRKLDLAKHKGLLAADAELQTAAKADGVPMPRLDGMIAALQSLHPDPEAGGRADAYADLSVPTKPPPRREPGTRADGQDKPPADPMKATIAKRNRDRLQGDARS